MIFRSERMGENYKDCFLAVRIVCQHFTELSVVVQEKKEANASHLCEHQYFGPRIPRH